MNSVKIKTKRKSDILHTLNVSFAFSVGEKLGKRGVETLWAIRSKSVTYTKYDDHNNIMVLVGDISHWDKQPFTYDRKRVGTEYYDGE